MSERRHPNVVHREEVPVMPMEKGKHKMKLRRLGGASGTQMLGANLTEVAPGCISFPFHYHCATEEALYVISGKGIARIGDQRVSGGTRSRASNDQRRHRATHLPLHFSQCAEGRCRWISRLEEGRSHRRHL